MGFSMLRIKKSGFVKFIIAGLLLFTFTTSASANYFGGSRTKNAKPVVYYDSSVSKYGYTSNFDAGRAYWNSHSAVNITKSTSYKKGMDQYLVANTSVAGLLGEIIPVNSSGIEVSTSASWSYVLVKIYANQMKNLSNYDSSHISMNAAHEIGHSIKMAHASKAYNSVMPQGWRKLPSSLTSYDKGEVTKKWGN